MHMNKIYHLPIFLVLLINNVDESSAQQLLLDSNSIKFTPAPSFKLYKSPDLPETMRLGEYRGGDDGAVYSFNCDYTSSIVFNNGSHEFESLFSTITINKYELSILCKSATGMAPAIQVAEATVAYKARNGWASPMPNGEIYRLDKFIYEKDGGSYAILNRVDWSDLGLKGKPDYARLYVPFGVNNEKGGANVGGGAFRFWSATDQTKGPDQPKRALECSINISHNVLQRQFGEQGPLQLRSTMIVQEGSVLPVLDVGFRILRIVPVDAEKKISGWVEIDLNPILFHTALGKEIQSRQRMPLVPTQSKEVLPTPINK